VTTERRLPGSGWLRRRPRATKTAYLDRLVALAESSRDSTMSSLRDLRIKPATDVLFAMYTEYAYLYLHVTARYLVEMHASQADMERFARFEQGAVKAILGHGLRRGAADPVIVSLSAQAMENLHRRHEIFGRHHLKRGSSQSEGSLWFYFGEHLARIIGEPRNWAAVEAVRETAETNSLDELDPGSF
jgi:hypothetical protein